MSLNPAFVRLSEGVSGSSPAFGSYRRRLARTLHPEQWRQCPALPRPTLGCLFGGCDSWGGSCWSERALTFTLPPESGPNSAILLNILSYGKSHRRRQRKRPGPAGSPLPSEAPLLPRGPTWRFQPGTASHRGSPRRGGTNFSRQEGVPEAHSALRGWRNRA